MPEYDRFAKILNKDPLFIGTGERSDLEKLKGYDSSIWIWGRPETTGRILVGTRK
jgi:hypothetical protein